VRPSAAAVLADTGVVSDTGTVADGGVIDAAMDAKPMPACALQNDVSNGGFESGLSRWTTFRFRPRGLSERDRQVHKRTTICWTQNDNGYPFSNNGKMFAGIRGNGTECEAIGSRERQAGPLSQGRVRVR
jgi:hypothetical protein